MANKGSVTTRVGYIILFIVVVPFLIYRLYLWYNLNRCSRYSVATGYQISGREGHESLRCIFYVNGKRYISYSFFDASASRRENGVEGYRGERHFVRYSCGNPNLSETLMNISVPDTIISIPKDGWEQLPIGLN